MRHRHRLVVIALLARTVMAPAPISAQTSQLPRQTIVFAIDNSGSMKQFDSLNLRGVAAGLVLDAGELASEVQAGLVFFSGDVQTVGGGLHPPDYIREKVQADNLPVSAGGTELAEALRRALALAGSGGSQIRKVVLITDGAVDDAQQREILDTLVPQAVAGGIQIFALGLSALANEVLLAQITDPTGGRTLISKDHEELLRRGKELVGDSDNVFTLAQEELASSQSEHTFELPPGTDRARLTLLLERPNVFAEDEIEIAIDGPEPGSLERKYLIRDDDGDRVAAWTTFLSAPGAYTLRVTVNKPGATGHQGVHLFLEALSILRLDVALRPELTCYTFGDEVRVEVQAATAIGSLDPAALQLRGAVRTADGGSQAIAFQGTEGRFAVPDVAGAHAVEITAETSEKLARKTVSRPFRACPPDPVELLSSRPEIEFGKPLSGAEPTIEEPFKLLVERPSGSRARRVRFSVQVVAPEIGKVELLAGGTPLKTNGTGRYTVPPEGLDLVLRISLEPGRSPREEDVRDHRGEILILSPEASSDLLVPFSFDVRALKFGLEGAPESFALWWDPERPRIVPLGRVSTDLEKESTFRVTLPESIHLPDGGRRLAAIGLRVGDAVAEQPEPDGGRRIFGPFDLPPGGKVPLALVVSPEPSVDWQELTTGASEVLVHLESSFGMEAAERPEYLSMGGAWAAVPAPLPRSLHARPWVQLLLVGGVGLVFLRRTLARLREVRRFRPFRVGATRDLGDGELRIGAADDAGATALALPNTGGALDDQAIGRVRSTPQGQELTDLSAGKLLVRGTRILAPRRLRPGDVLGVVDPDQPGERRWEIEYVDYTPEQGGLVEVLAAPPSIGLGRLGLGILLGLLLIAAVAATVDSEGLAGLAYRAPFVERLYAWWLA